MEKRKNRNGRIAALLALTLFVNVLLGSFGVFSGSTRAEGTETREIVSDDASILTQETLEMLRARAEQEKAEALRALYASLMATETKAEAEVLVADMSDEEWNAFTASLTDEEYDALMQHFSAFEERTIRPAERYVNAGPLLDAVMVNAPTARFARLMSRSTANENGLILSKSAEKSGDGYKITLEAYTTGDVTTQDVTEPVDVYLVLDQSGSMDENFGSWRYTRQDAMKTAVTNFINSVANKYSENGSDHRIGIITYTDAGKVRSKLRKVDAAGKNALINIVNNLNADGDTRQGAGLKLVDFAQCVSGSEVTKTEGRKQVVILFTDGVPAESGTDDFNVAWGNEAVAEAKKLKDAGVTLYTIGIFDGAKQDELHGANFGGRYRRNSWNYAEIACTGEVGSLWGGYYETWYDWSAYSRAEMDVAAANRMMNYISSNFPNATSLGLEFGTQSFTSGGNTYSGNGYKITYNASRAKSGYYLTASNSDDLDDIFDAISEQIETPTIELGADTVIQDVVTPYFDLPASDADIKVYTQNYNGTAFAGDRADVTSQMTVTRDAATNKVSVKGFDFNANFVTDTAKENGTYGKKLIIEFTVTAREGFLGGNQVPTNVAADSGVYLDGESVEAFSQEPKVDVPIPAIVVTAADKNVYLLNSLSLNDLKNGATISVGGATPVNYETWLAGLEDWQKAYVNISDSLTYGNDETSVPDTGLSNLTEDDVYAFGCTIAPKQTGTYTQQTASDSANIYVFKPQITASDKVCDYNETVTLGNQVNSTIAWTHPGKENLDPAGAPSLLLTYYPGRGTTSAATHTVVAETEVDIKVAIGSVDVTGYTTFVRNACTFANCGNSAQTSHLGSADACEFVLHLGAGNLKITKSGGAAGQTYIFNVTGGGKTFRVAVVGNDSVTIANLPLGVTYTVTEDEGWSWRYSASPVSVVLDAAEKEVTITNAKDKTQWLDDEVAVCNNFNAQ